MKKRIKKEYHTLIKFIKFTILVILIFLGYDSITPRVGKTTFYIPSSNVKSITEALQKENYNIYPIDTFLLRFMKLPKKGWYTIGERKEGRFEFLKSLYTKQVNTMQIRVFAGETSKELTKRLANDMKLSHYKLLKAYRQETYFHEGDIIAGRYVLARNADENTTISYLFDTSKELFNYFENYIAHKKFSSSEKKVLLTLASIIQKESNDVKEMPLISSVIYNRLKKNMRLQMDGTLNYGEYSHQVITPERIKNDTSYYNTYKYKGLPPYPLCSVNIDSLTAAYYPKKTDYLFFMLTKDGTHIFANNFDAHLKNIHTYKKERETKEKENNLTETLKKNDNV